MVKTPSITPWMAILQLPEPFKVQLDPTVPVVLSDEVNDTVPVGMIVEFTMSVTTTEQERVAPVLIFEGQVIDIDVLSFCPKAHVTLKIAMVDVLVSVKPQ